MKVHRLAVAAATLCGLCMLRDARAELSSASDYAQAAYPAALLYLIVNQDVSGRDEDALTAYSQLLVAALVRAPR